MITASKYFDTVKGINFSELPDNLQKGHAFVIKATENGANWNAYESESIKRVMDAYFSKMDAYLEANPAKVKKAHPIKETHVPPAVKTFVKKHHAPKHIEPVHEDDFTLVERIPDELRFLRRYVSLNNKKKSKDDLLRFINALHRAIIEKKIRKTSPYAKQMHYIQDKLVKTYNEMTKPMTMQVSDKIINEFKALIASEKIMPSVALIKRYISLNGKYAVKDRAKLLMDAMTRAFDKGKVAKKDQYFKIFDQMHHNLSQYVKNKSQKILSIQQTELNGLNGFLSGCGCHTVSGNEEVNGLECIEDSQELVQETLIPSNGVMSSMDFKNMQFKTLGFVGKYRKLIGDPAKGFSAMVYGKPKMGKSFLCVDFAGYLARNHGKVLYVAKEEGLDMTLQDKLKAKDVAHPNLFVAQDIPGDLTPYEFIFFDSVNKLGLSVQDLTILRQNNPQKSFVYIFQTTKEGNFRGGNEFQHDVDIVIEVPEKGLAVQNGRYNQGGEMKIFEDQEYRQAA